MKRYLKLMILVLVLGVLVSCSAEAKSPKQIFPKREESWVGDPMPYWDGKEFKVFYLDDLRNGDFGYHPWSLLTTKDFVSYKDEGIVIPYGTKGTDQDVAIGTGSVVQDKDGLYHSFYTGHNAKKFPKEAVMHATSEDMINWTKIPEDTFRASEQYAADDFRDPYVIYNDDYEEYWMLLTTRKGNLGVVALYTSQDLVTWEDEGVLFENDMDTDSNLECPTLIKFDGHWYLSFSDQWPDRVVHYRMATDSKGPFTKPEKDHFDGNGFYAGRMEKDDENLYMFGWTPTKVRYSDNEDYDWGGNLVVHQLMQKDNGELYPVPVTSVVDSFSKAKNIAPLLQTETILKDKDTYHFSGNDFELLTFAPIVGTQHFSAEVKIDDTDGKFGFMFNVADTNIGTLNLVVDIEKQELQFYNKLTDTILNEKPQSTMAADFVAGDTVKIDLFIENSTVVLYFDDQAVLSSRMFSLRDREWGFFGIDSKIELQNAKLSK